MDAFLLWVVSCVKQGRTDLFYNCRRWRRKRREVLKAAHYECAICKAAGKYTEADTVHHIKHLREFPMLAMEDTNLQALCPECHYRIHHPEESGVRWNDERW